MNNKVLIKLWIPELELSFDVFIPVNEVVWKIKLLLAKAVSSLTLHPFPSKEFILIHKEHGKVYHNNEIILQTDIRNGTELLLLMKKPS